MFVRKLILVFAICLQTVVINCQNKNNKVTVEIFYNGEKQDERFSTNWVEGMTALEALQSCANVITRKAGDHTFVNGINGVSNNKGIKAWLYKVNGNYAPKAAFNNIINLGDTITWIYNEDKCPLCKPKKDKCEE